MRGAVTRRKLTALRRATPNTVVIPYPNFPTKLLEQLTDFELEIGMGMGGPDVDPREEVISHPVRGVYRLCAKLAGTVAPQTCRRRSMDRCS